MHKAKGFFFRKRILESVSFLIFFFKNGLWNPFGNFFFWKRIVESVSCLWNGFCNLFHKKIRKLFYETNYGIRFTVLWNGFCNPFPINFDFFGETAFVFRLIKVWNALYSLWNRKQIPFHFTSKQKKTLASKKLVRRLTWMGKDNAVTQNDLLSNNHQSNNLRSQ